MSEKYQEIIQQETPTLVDFYADWCGPCKALAPTLERLKKDWGDKVRILKINVDKNPTLSQKLNVRGVPTLILYQNGIQLWRESGAYPKEQLKSMVESSIQ